LFWACFGLVLGLFWACFGLVLGELELFEVVDVGVELVLGVEDGLVFGEERDDVCLPGHAVVLLGDVEFVLGYDHADEFD